MPFGLNYAGQFDSFTYSNGVMWVLFLFIYLFCFSYFALRGKKEAWRLSLYVTTLALVANIILITLQVPAIVSLVLGISIYLLVSFFVTRMRLADLLKVSCIVSVNLTIASFVPDYLGLFYDIFLLYIFYLMSENRLKKEAAPLPAPQMPIGM